MEEKEKKTYLIAFGESGGTDFKTLFITRRRLFLYGFLAGVAILILAFLISGLFYLFEIRIEKWAFREENERLKNRLAEFESRLTAFQEEMKALNTRNQQIRIAAALTLPEISYGVGGDESPLLLDQSPTAMEKRIATNLSKLEAEFAWLKQSTLELEGALTTKITQITHFPSIRPVRGGIITSGFGRRIDPFTGLEEDHLAVDISIPPGTEVRATGAGVVKEVETRVVKNKGYGQYILIDHGFGYQTFYAHLSKIFVTEGQRVKRWDLIGLSGNTGKSTAPHLHYAVWQDGKERNPVDFFLD